MTRKEAVPLVLALAAFAALALIPGCGSNLTLAQQQQIALNVAKDGLTGADQAALACLAADIPLCVSNKVKIKQDAQKLDDDLGQAQKVINSGADAQTLLATIQLELAALLAELPPAKA